MPDRMPKPPPAEDGVNDAALRGTVGYNLRRAYLTLHDDFLASLADLDLRAVSFSTLSLVVDNPEINQSRLAAALSMEPSNIVVVIDELQQRALVTRNKVATDRRAYALRATLKGRRLRDRALRVIAEHEDRLLADFSREERAALVGMLNRIES
jgi:DNA-binding MarR family transcriptional regulator